MSSLTRHRALPSGATVGWVLMVLAFASQSFGIGKSTGIAPLHATAYIVGLGVPIYGLTVLATHMYRVFRHGERGFWVTFTRVQWIGTGRIFVGNLLVNLGWPYAGGQIGVGAAASILALGPVSVGVVEDYREGRHGRLWLRAGVMAGVIFVTEPWQGASFSIVGVLAAFMGAIHFWNIPKSLDMLQTDGATKRQQAKELDQGMFLSNLAAWLPIVGGVFIVEGYDWVQPEFSKGIWAPVFVMVIPIIMMNLAKLGLSEAQQGVLFALNPAVGGIMGYLGDRYDWFPSEQRITPSTVVGITLVSLLAYLVLVTDPTREQPPFWVRLMAKYRQLMDTVQELGVKTEQATTTATQATIMAQRAEDMAQRAEDKAEQAEDKAQRAEDKAQRAEDKAERAEDKAQQAEDKAERAEDKAQRAEDAVRQVARTAIVETATEPTGEETTVETAAPPPVTPAEATGPQPGFVGTDWPRPQFPWGKEPVGRRPAVGWTPSVEPAPEVPGTTQGSMSDAAKAEGTPEPTVVEAAASESTDEEDTTVETATTEPTGEEETVMMTAAELAAESEAAEAELEEAEARLRAMRNRVNALREAKVAADQAEAAKAALAEALTRAQATQEQFKAAMGNLRRVEQEGSTS